MKTINYFINERLKLNRTTQINKNEKCIDINNISVNDEIFITLIESNVICDDLIKVIVKKIYNEPKDDNIFLSLLNTFDNSYSPNYGLRIYKETLNFDDYLMIWEQDMSNYKYILFDTREKAEEFINNKGKYLKRIININKKINSI